MNNWLRQYPFKNLVLIGFSGGGTLAVLMAPYLPQVSRVITVAANFDTDSWSLHHGYLPLKHSLNPINMSALSPNIKQIHLAGLQDKNIPAEMIKKFANQQINAMFMPIAEFNHHCCWANIWSELLPKITQNEQ